MYLLTLTKIMAWILCSMNNIIWNCKSIDLKSSRIIQLLYATYKMYQDEKVISSDGQIFVEFRGTSQTSTTVRSIIRQRPQVAGWWRLLTPNRSYVDEAQQLYSNAMFFKHFSSSLYCCFMHTISLLLLLMFTYFLVVWLYHAHAKT